MFFFAENEGWLGSWKLERRALALLDHHRIVYIKPRRPCWRQPSWSSCKNDRHSAGDYIQPDRTLPDGI